MNQEEGALSDEEPDIFVSVSLRSSYELPWSGSNVQGGPKLQDFLYCRLRSGGCESVKSGLESIRRQCSDDCSAISLEAG